MKILIIGLDHQIQSTEEKSDARLVHVEREQKEQFRRLLERIVRERRVDFIGEEFCQSEVSIASRLLDSEKYANVEMPTQLRQERGIPSDYTTNLRVTDERHRQFDSLREDYIAETFRSKAAAAHARSVLLLCGRRHLAGLSERLKRLSQDHDVEDYDLRVESWYLQNWEDGLFGRGV